MFVKENALEVNRVDLYSVEQECDLSFLIALLKASRPNFNTSVTFTVNTWPGCLNHKGSSKILN